MWNFDFFCCKHAKMKMQTQFRYKSTVLNNAKDHTCTSSHTQVTCLLVFAVKYD